MTILKPFLLIVEGSSDKNFFESLCKFMTINDIEIIEVGGVSRFMDQVGAIIRMDGFENVKTFGIIRDADNNVNQAFNSVQDVLRNNNLPVPHPTSNIIPFFMGGDFDINSNPSLN